jgi:hypothetical protein
MRKEFTFKGKGKEVEVAEYSGPGGHVEIPNMFAGKPVTAILEGAFYACTSLTSVTIPHNIASIGDGAFSYCSSLTSVIIQGNVPHIGHYAFANCTSLTSISFLGQFAPIEVGENWIQDVPVIIRGYAYAASNFPNPEEDYHGLTMGAAIPAISRLPDRRATGLSSDSSDREFAKKLVIDRKDEMPREPQPQPPLLKKQDDRTPPPLQQKIRCSWCGAQTDSSSYCSFCGGKQEGS